MVRSPGATETETDTQTKQRHTWVVLCYFSAGTQWGYGTAGRMEWPFSSLRKICFRGRKFAGESLKFRRKSDFCQISGSEISNFRAWKNAIPYQPFYTPKKATSCRKMHFPTEKCAFLQKNAIFLHKKYTSCRQNACRKWGFRGGHGRKPQEIAERFKGKKIAHRIAICICICVTVLATPRTKCGICVSVVITQHHMQRGGGAALKGTNLRGRSPICGFLRVPAVFCEKICVSQRVRFLRKGEICKISELLRKSAFGLGYPKNLLRLFFRNNRCGVNIWATFGGF